MKVGKTTLAGVGWMIVAWGWVYLAIHYVRLGLSPPIWAVMSDDPIRPLWSFALWGTGIGLGLVLIDYVHSSKQEF